MSVTIHLEDRLSTGPNPTPNLQRKSSDSSRVISSINERWEENLDAEGDVSLCQFEASSDALGWHRAHHVRGQNEPTISTGVHLSLLEGLSRESIASFGKPPFDASKEFFHNHFLDYLPSSQPEPTSNCFFFKWPRQVLQESGLWDRETRIRINKPYDSNTSADPEKLGLDHQRFQQHPRIYRPYDTLEPQLNNRSSLFPDPTSYPGYIRHAAHECCSFFYKKANGRFIGVLVFDARRQHIITERRYVRRKLSNKNVQETVEDCFVDDPTTRERFIKELNRIGPVKVAKDPERVIKAIISKFIREDYLDVLVHLRNALDYVDLAMSNDDILQDAIPNWRSLFGRWRKEFPQIKGFIFEILHHYKAPGREAALQVSEHAEDPGVALWLQKEFSSIARDMEVVGKRAKLTFQALMSTMAIVESEKAIAQAKTISKLTNLAFFFIPLTLAASIFGMDMLEWHGKLKIWTWVAVSIGLSVATYVVHFWQDIFELSRHVPTYMRSINWQRTPVITKRYSLTIYYYFKLALEISYYFFLFLLCTVPAAGVGASFWAFFTQAHLPLAGKIIIFIVFLSGIGVGVAILPCYLIAIARD